MPSTWDLDYLMLGVTMLGPRRVVPGFLLEFAQPLGWLWNSAQRALAQSLMVEGLLPLILRIERGRASCLLALRKPLFQTCISWYDLAWLFFFDSLAFALSNFLLLDRKLVLSFCIGISFSSSLMTFGLLDIYPYLFLLEFVSLRSCIGLLGNYLAILAGRSQRIRT